MSTCYFVYSPLSGGPLGTLGYRAIYFKSVDAAKEWLAGFEMCYDDNWFLENPKGDAIYPDDIKAEFGNTQQFLAFWNHLQIWRREDTPFCNHGLQLELPEEAVEE